MKIQNSGSQGLPAARKLAIDNDHQPVRAAPREPLPHSLTITAWEATAACQLPVHTRQVPVMQTELLLR